MNVLSWILVLLFVVAAGAIAWRVHSNRRAFATADELARRNLVGRQAVVMAAMDVGATGRVQLLGTHWQAVNRGERALKEREEVAVVDVVKMVAHVRSEKAS